MYEVIVVGAGHAGCEAALACAKMNHKTLLITGSLENIAKAPCNPSIGGPAKGIVVREIDALGGQMGKITDKSLLQIKMLNTKKGPAVQALRAQIDKIEYQKNMKETLLNQENLTLKEALVDDLITKDNKVCGVILSNKEEIKSNIVILTTGTYLKSNILIGLEKKISGPDGEKTSQKLSNCLKKLGFTIQRLKTGTPPRLKKSSIDFSKTEIAKGDKEYLSFSHLEEYFYDVNKQLDCYLTYTNEKTHEIIRNNLDKTSMYSGLITGIGPRYCPSIETKIERFKDKDRHQLFLEPESIHYDDIYLQGFSTSMSKDIQEEMVHSIKGLEHAEILKYAYAIEYDAIDPLELKQTLETKIIENLYTAGQINGTSGYEEAACQGLMAGINASLKLENKDPLILKRNEAYIGVLIDDLVTKGTNEPYRLLTSRAEYRLLLRNDNADLRLSEYGHKIGLLSPIQYEKYLERKENINTCLEQLKTTYLNPTKQTNEYLKNINTNEIKNRISLYDLLKRPEVSQKDIAKYLKTTFSNDILNEIEIITKYDGYIKKQEKEAKKMLEYEKMLIKEDIDYNKIDNIAKEAREKLNKVKPTTIAQASRISGVNPQDIAILAIYLKKRNQNG